MASTPRPVGAQLIHVVSRGVDKRKIFMDEHDRVRFIHNLFEFNNQNEIDNIYYRYRKNRFLGGSDFVGNRRNKPREPRKLLIELQAFCLMPNHYHLLLSEKMNGGMIKFMSRLNMGYARYFNNRHERSGALFEGRYKSLAITNQAHFIHLPYYVHCNPLDLDMPEWRERELKDYRGAVKFLETYRWSSHLDYCGVHNFPSVTQRDFLLEFFDGSEGYKKNITGWLKEFELELIEDLLLD